MKKKTLTNILTKAITVLLIILISVIAFLGIQKKELNSWKNILPNYTLSKELSSIRIFTFSVDNSTEEVEDETAQNTESTETPAEGEEAETTETPKKQVPVNDPSLLNTDNYKKSKDIISERLKKFGVTDYSVTVNENNGEISVDVPYESITDYTVSLAINKGTLSINDTDSKETLISQDLIKSVTVNYKKSDGTSTAESNYASYDIGLVLKFKKDGLNKLNEISKKYIETMDENGETTRKTITVQIDGEDKYTTYFSPDGQYTELFIPISQNVSTEKMDNFNDKYNEAAVIASELNTETMPIKYSLSKGTFIESSTGERFLKYATVVGAIIIAIISIIMIAKYKLDGLLATIIEIGFIAIHSLLIRAATVSLTLSGLATILLVALTNYMLIKTLMNKEKVIAQLEACRGFLLNIIPFIITIIVFAFSKNIHLQSVGMVAIWGVITFMYTLFVSILLLRKNNKKNGVE